MDLSSKKTLTLVMFGVVLGAILLIFIWFPISREEISENAEKESFPQSTDSDFRSNLGLNNDLGQFQERENDGESFYIGLKNGSTKADFGFLGLSEPFLPKTIKKEEAKRYIAEALPILNYRQTDSGQAPLPYMTDAEIFDALYPDFYIDSLKAAQQTMLDEGVLTFSAAVDFKNEDEVRKFHEKLAEYLVDSQIIEADRAKSYLDGARSVYDASREFKVREAASMRALREGKIPVSLKNPFVTPEEAQEEFRDLLRQQGYELEEVLKDVSRRNVSEKMALSKHLVPLAAFINRVFLVNSAQAKCACKCLVLPVCFLEGVPRPIGWNVPFVPCCVASNCCWYLGCFNICEGTTNPFIWDPITGICGCG